MQWKGLVLYRVGRELNRGAREKRRWVTSGNGDEKNLVAMEMRGYEKQWNRSVEKGPDLTSIGDEKRSFVAKSKVLNRKGTAKTRTETAWNGWEMRWISDAQSSYGMAVMGDSMRRMAMERRG